MNFFQALLLAIVIFAVLMVITIFGIVKLLDVLLKSAIEAKKTKEEEDGKQF